MTKRLGLLPRDPENRDASWEKAFYQQVEVLLAIWLKLITFSKIQYISQRQDFNNCFTVTQYICIIGVIGQY